jgi:hypothetical protein
VQVRENARKRKRIPECNQAGLLRFEFAVTLQFGVSTRNGNVNFGEG